MYLHRFRVALAVFYRVLRRKQTSYQRSGFMQVLEQASKKDYPVPSVLISVIEKALEPFLHSIKY
jgi:hypothetical protein